MSKRRSWVRVLVVLSVLALVATACGDGEEEAAETTAAPTTAAPTTTAAPEPEEPIKLGTVWFNSGTAVGLGDIMRNGFELAVMQQNEAGGVLGRQVEVIHYDEGYSA
ncbi:MAG: ABC transporter substrate-binding protein, partial [Acidimicrobiia bacterium]|nr:ABC transporter substrate-binding protein [Acidimicrobiia bacterium]